MTKGNPQAIRPRHPSASSDEEEPKPPQTTAQPMNQVQIDALHAQEQHENELIQAELIESVDGDFIQPIRSRLTERDKRKRGRERGGRGRPLGGAPQGLGRGRDEPSDERPHRESPKQHSSDEKIHCKPQEATQLDAEVDETDLSLDMLEDILIPGLTAIQKQLRQQGDTVIHELALNDNPTLLNDFIRSGCRIFNLSTYDGGTALHRAAESNSVECARILIDHRADVDAIDSIGQTPFHVAAAFKNIEVGRILYRNGAKRSCRKNCGKCKLLSKAIMAINKQNRAKADKLRREQREKEEQKVKEEEEQQAESEDFHSFLEQMKKEMGGPFVNQDDNRKLKQLIKKNKRELAGSHFDGCLSTLEEFEKEIHETGFYEMPEAEEDFVQAKQSTMKKPPATNPSPVDPKKEDPEKPARKKRKKNKKKSTKKEASPTTTTPSAPTMAAAALSAPSTPIHQSALEEEKNADDPDSPQEVPLRKQQRLAELQQQKLKEELLDQKAAPEVAGPLEESCPAASAAYSSSDEGRVPETLEKGEEAKEEGQSSGNEEVYF